MISFGVECVWIFGCWFIGNRCECGLVWVMVIYEKIMGILKRLY